jgi:radical SAM protein with 4Fe4S-binding SPASM domain
VNRKYYLSSDILLRWLETPSVYNVKRDELYEVDERGFQFLQSCMSEEGCFTDDKEFIQYCLDEGILTQSPSQPRPQMIKKSPEPSLRYLEFLITDRCNLRCLHCYIDPSEQNELSTEDVIKVLEEFNEMQGLKVLLSGGEPLMYRDFMRLNEFLKEYPLRKVLLTNGILLKEENLSKLNVHEIQFSIDGIGSSHEAIRGKDTFSKTIQTLKMAIEFGFDVSVSTMIHRGNLDQFDEMESLFRELGVREWIVDVPCATGRLLKNPELVVPPEAAGRYLRYGYGGGFHGSGEGFGCGLHLVSVLPNGAVSKCAFYSDSPVGYVSEGLRECWQRIKPVEIKELSCNCDFLEICRGGCRYRAELYSGPSGPDPYKCYAFGVRIDNA